MNSKNRKEQGFALVMVLVALLVISLMLTTGVKRSQVDTSLAGAWSRRTRAAGVSETGIAVIARKVFDQYTSAGNFNSLLGTAQMGTTGGGQYSVLITDNDTYGSTTNTSENGNFSTDTDNIFRLESSGMLGTSEEVIVAYFKIPPATTSSPPSSTGIGALGLCANQTDIANASTIQGADYNLPSYPCSGSGCNGSAGSGPAAAGISYNSGTTINVASGTAGGNPATNNNANINCNAWTSFLTSAAAVAQNTYTASAGPFNANATAFGTDIAPKIVVIQGSGENVKFNGNLFGNGILIIKNCQVEFTGTFTYAGLVLISDEGGGLTFKGTPQIFGSTMVLSANTHDSQIEIDAANNNSRIRYSTQGLARAAQAFTNASTGSSSSLQVLAWRTISN